MSDARRYGTSYHQPHPQGRLAFLEYCVLAWCEADAAGTPPTDDPSFLAFVEGAIRKDVQSRLPEAPAETVDYFVRVGLEGYRHWEQARFYAGEIEKMKAPRPPKGNLRREVPAHLPVRPTRTIVAHTAQHIQRQAPTLSRSSIYAETAQWLNDGIVKSQAAGRLDKRNVRSACEAHGILDDVGTLIDRQVRARRQRTRATAHLWDCTQLDWLQSGAFMTERWGSSPGEALLLRERAIDWPLAAFERLYARARAGKRFAGLSGLELAKAIDATLGLREMAAQELDRHAGFHPKTVSISAPRAV
jgi:hypothetical protein